MASARLLATVRNSDWLVTELMSSKSEETSTNSDPEASKFLDRSTTDIAWQITGRLMTGILLYGAIGWLLGLWLGNQKVFTAAGILFGMFAGLYLVYARLRADEITPPKADNVNGQSQWRGR